MFWALTTVFPRKRFGQHFLKDRQIIDKIIKALNPQPDDNLVEIGAGTGALTAQVLRFIKHLNVVEIDRDLCQKLRSTYSPADLTVYEQDALQFDFSGLCTDKSQTLRVFGNLPYNISTPLLFHLLSYTHLINDMLFMLQKEVAQRICAVPKHHEYGRLTIMVQYACQPQMLFDIKPNAFSPPPKVMSSVIRLKPFSENFPHPIANDFKLFSQVVAVAFQHRRKTLKNALETLVPVTLFEKVNIDPIRRPETMSVAEFVALSNALALQT
ncbi:MAG: 16S rRNA (adenine(1518)-N(6)/adenine(1519)-N(6))-dimethyltransferase RsmA [Candidatus Berkiellales bacterium]